MMLFDSLIAWKIPGLARWKVVGIGRDGSTYELSNVHFCIRRNAARWARQANEKYADDPIRFAVMAVKR